MRKRITALVTVTLLILAFAIPTLASDDPVGHPAGPTMSSLTSGQISAVTDRTGVGMSVIIDGESRGLTLYSPSEGEVNSAQARLYALVGANPQLAGSQQVRTFRFSVPDGLEIPAGGVEVLINVPNAWLGTRYMALYSTNHGYSWSQLPATVVAHEVVSIRFQSLNSLVSIVRLTGDAGTGGAPRSPQTGQ